MNYVKLAHVFELTDVQIIQIGTNYFIVNTIKYTINKIQHYIYTTKYIYSIRLYDIPMSDIFLPLTETGDLYNISISIIFNSAENIYSTSSNFTRIFVKIKDLKILISRNQSIKFPENFQLKTCTNSEILVHFDLVKIQQTNLFSKFRYNNL